MPRTKLVAMKTLLEDSLIEINNRTPRSKNTAGSGLTSKNIQKHRERDAHYKVMQFIHGRVNNADYDYAKDTETGDLKKVNVTDAEGKKKSIKLRVYTNAAKTKLAKDFDKIYNDLVKAETDGLLYNLPHISAFFKNAYEKIFFDYDISNITDDIESKDEAHNAKPEVESVKETSPAKKKSALQTTSFFQTRVTATQAATELLPDMNTMIQSYLFEDKDYGKIVDDIVKWVNTLDPATSLAMKKAKKHDDYTAYVLGFLSDSDGFKSIKSYDELCIVAELLIATGQNTLNPPCLPVEFAELVDNQFEPNDPERPVLGKEVEALLAKNKFYQWREKNVKDPLIDPYNSLSVFLYEGPGFRYIKTFDQFCDIISNISADFNRKYPTPTLQQFANIVDGAYQNATKPVLTAEMGATLALERFREWSRKYYDEHGNDRRSDYPGKDLCVFLTEGGFTYVKSYPILCELVKDIRMLPNFKNTPLPDEIQYTTTAIGPSTNWYRGEPPVVSSAIKNELLLNDFARWKQTAYYENWGVYTPHGNADSTRTPQHQAILNYICSVNVLIETYEEFCLATEMIAKADSGRDLNIPIPLCSKAEFDFMSGFIPRPEFYNLETDSDLDSDDEPDMLRNRPRPLF